MNLPHYISAAFPAVAVETVEEDRLAQYLLEAFPNKPLFAICASGGLRDLRSHLVTDAQANFTKAFTMLSERSDSLLLVFDWQHLARNAVAYRALKDQFAEFKARGCCAILVAPRWSLPPELEHDLPVIAWQLPTRPQLRAALQVVAQSVGETISPAQEAACLEAAAGLTLQEAENAYALSLVQSGHIEAAHVVEEKMRLIRSSGFLEVWPTVSPEAVGGLGQLKDYITQEALPVRDDDDLRVRGLLLVGVPGAGKSLAAKAIGAMMSWPVLRMDVGKLKGSLVGQSEANMSAALRLAEAVAPAVLFLDEIEKGFGGYQSSAQSDSGVTLSMLGNFLTWQQEHRAPILTVATANSHAMLPAELTRAGRFDESFFVDLPSQSEREEIARIHLQRFGCADNQASDLETLAGHMAELSVDWTGAEVEQCLKSAARRSGRQPTTELITSCSADIRPIVRTRASEFETLRSWAQTALRGANTPDATDIERRPSQGNAIEGVRVVSRAGNGPNPQGISLN